jgi:hypothetical protein
MAVKKTQAKTQTETAIATAASAVNPLAAVRDVIEKAKRFEKADYERKEQRLKSEKAVYAENYDKLVAARAELRRIAPEAREILRCVDDFPWHQVRDLGMPEEIVNSRRELRNTLNGGAVSIQHDIDAIDDFGVADLDKKSRPSLDIGGTLAIVGDAKLHAAFLNRALPTWGEKLGKKITAGGSEAIEGDRPPREPGGVLTNIDHSA